MTTLTPPSAEHCAMIDEAARQHKSGEYAARYWEWKTVYENCIATPMSYKPAPAHPHYATYCEWQRLIDSGEAGRGWWMIDCDDGKTFNPKWHIHFAYYIVKTDKHPDNAKPALKLIDWAKFVGLSGLMTSEGVFFGLDKNGNASLMRMMGVFPKCMVVPTDMIKIVEQTTFTHLPEGTPPPVVEGLVFKYEYTEPTNNSRHDAEKYQRGRTPHAELASDAHAYRVIGLAPGYTDNPELAQ